MRKRRHSLTIITILLLLPFVVQASNCESFFHSPQLKTQIKNLQQYSKNNKNIWDGYNINDEIVIFTDLINAPKCYLTIHQGNIVQVGQLEHDLKSPNNIYGFFYLKRGNIPEVFRKKMKELKKNEAMFFSLHEMTFIPKHIKSLLNENGLIFNMILHEGFHLFYQRRSQVNTTSQLLWPKWLKFPEYEAVVNYCYHQPKIIHNYHKEVRSLTRAAKLMYLIKDKAAAIEAAKEFISSREKRYEIIKKNKLTVPLVGENNRISCRLAEDSLEIDEGVTNFIGAKAALDLGLITNFQFIEFSNLLDFNPYFYGSSQLQLYLLSGLASEVEFNDIKNSISSSKSSSLSVFSIFKNFLKNQEI